MTRLGFVGLGAMGSRMVKRLLAGGYPVAGYNRTLAKAQALIKDGLQICASPREVVEIADITFSMVTDTTALSAITEGPEGILAGLTTGKIYVDMSTVNPRFVRDLAARAATAGAQMLEAPVSGSIPAAESGTLVMFVGGEAETLERVRPVLEILSQKILHIGSSGQGVSTKIAINLSLPIQLIALFEGLLLAERSGIPREVALDALLNSVIASPAIKYRAPFILNMPQEVWFNVTMMEKDVRLALEMGEQLGVPLSSAKLSAEMLSKAKAMGYGEQDFAALFQTLAQMSGTAAV
jgi:3-hydroxyisobutyrate dehydrogenase-like beta-hydroxyacid dehydrogenase